MPKEDEEEVSLLISPEEEEQEEQKRRPPPRAVSAPLSPNSSLSVERKVESDDPLKLEKTSKVERPGSGYERKYAQETPVLRGQKDGAALYGILAFVFAVAVGFGGIRMLTGKPLVPQPVQELVKGKEAPVVLQPARFTIQTPILGYEVAVNGVKQSIFNNQFEHAAGSDPLTISLSRVGYSTFTTQIVPAAGASLTIVPVLAQLPQATGFLTFETVPEAHLVLLQEGKIVAEFNTPVTGAKVPVGTYQAVLENTFMGFRKEQSITIEEWKTTSFRVTLGGQGAAENPAEKKAP